MRLCWTCIWRDNMEYKITVSVMDAIELRNSSINSWHAQSSFSNHEFSSSRYPLDQIICFSFFNFLAWHCFYFVISIFISLFWREKENDTISWMLLSNFYVKFHERSNIDWKIEACKENKCPKHSFIITLFEVQTVPSTTI